jgi:hypothetical protein
MKKNIKKTPNHIDSDLELVLKEGGQNKQIKKSA